MRFARGTGEKHFHSVLLHVKLREIILLADGKFCPKAVSWP